MKKKVLLFFVALLATGQSAFAYSFSAVAPSGQTLYYYITTDSTVAVTFPGSTFSYPYGGYTKPTGALTIPASVTNDGTTYSVTLISYGAFSNCSGLTSVTIPNSIISIVDYAFEFCGLTSVTIPNSVTSIGVRAFYACGSLPSVTIPNSVTSIGDYAFYACSSLTSVTIPNSVTSIGNYAFYGCSSLTSIIVANGNTVYDSRNNCNAIIETATNNLIQGCISTVIPNTITSIGNEAFRGCSGLTSFTIPNSVTSIGDYAFYACSGLDTVYMMPTTPPVIYGSTFSNNASSRVFILTGCSYDNYYTTNSNDSWYIHRNDIRHALYDINVNISSSNSAYGTATVVLGPSDRVVRCDSTVVVQATAITGYHFDQWSNGSTANRDTLTLTGDTTIMAIFERNRYNLTVNANDTSLGLVTTPQGTSALYQDTLMVVAKPIDHYHVANWQGQGVVATSAHKDTAWVKMNNNCTLTCNFAIDTHTVSVVSSDLIRGMVTQNGTEFVYLTPCTVEATAYTGYTFAGWSNGMTANPYTFAVISDVELTALFVEEGEEVYTVTVESADPTMGTVSGGGLALSGGTLTIRAIPNDGYRFQCWNDGNTENPRTVTVTGNITYTAYFESIQGIGDVDAAEVKVFASEGHIVVRGAEGMETRVYDLTGREVVRPNQNGETPVLPSGVYLVKVGTLPARKVVVMR